MHALLLLLLVVAPSFSWVIDSPLQRNTISEEDGYELQSTVWQGPQSFNLSTVVSRWSLPPDPYTDAELGSGISWALHPSFCDEILGLFPEEQVGSLAVLLDCGALRTAVARSFDTWAANHKKIYFTDVTAQCAEATDNVCDAAEVYIYPDREFSAANDLAAFVFFQKSNKSGLLFNKAPYTTAGMQVQGYGIQSAVMKVRTQDICWYLDATFCYHFHSIDSSFDVITVMRLLFCAIYILSSLVILRLFYMIISALLEGFVLKKQNSEARRSSDLNDPMSEGHDLTTTSEKRCGPLLDYLAQISVGWVMIALFWLVFCPIFYFNVFLPCWDCFDFEATMAHEIGHILGFNHPDTFTGSNLAATGDGVMGPDVCMDPLRNVQLAPLPDGADSIMFSVTKARDRTCLTADDVQGLHYLYPTCEGADPEPQCLKERRTSGYLRLLITVALPYFIMSLLLFLMISAVRCHQRRQLQELEERVANVRERGRILTDFLYSMGNIAASPGGSRPHRQPGQSSPSQGSGRLRCTMSRPGGGGGAATPAGERGRLRWAVSRPRLRRGTESSAPHGLSSSNVTGTNVTRDEVVPLSPRQRLSPSGERPAPPPGGRPSPRASERARREEESQLAAAQLASEEESQMAAAIQASLVESDTHTARPIDSRPSTAWGSASHSASSGGDVVDFPAALAVGGGDVSPDRVNNGYV